MLVNSLVAVAAVGLSFLMTPMIGVLASRCGVVAEGSARGPNGRPVPLLGGLAIVLALIGSIAFARVLDSDLVSALGPRLWVWRWSAIGAILIAALGVVDDIYKVKPITKVVFQMIAALLVVADGHGIGRIINPFTGEPIMLGWLAAPITLLWIIGITNAFNLIDGLDGLAAGIGLIAAATLSIIALSTRRPDVALLTAALIGALAGFLYYNVSPASIFMGDSGSMFVGYVLAALYVRGSQQPSGVPLVTPILALSVPIADTLLAVIRRGFWPSPRREYAAKREPVLGRFLAIFRRDREHIHHRLIKAGLKESDAVLVLYGVAIVSGALALLSFHSETASLFCLAILGAAIYGGIRTLRSNSSDRALNL